MTRDDVIRMACKAGFMAYGNHDVYATHDDLQRFAAMVAASEREACVIAAEKVGAEYLDGSPGRWMAGQCAEAIRARSNA